MKSRIFEMTEIAKKAMPALDARLLKDEIQQLAERMARVDGCPTIRTLKTIRDNMEFRRSLVTAFRKMESDLTKIQSGNERIERMLLFLSFFTGEGKLKKDRKAFSRWMDAAAVRERARIALHRSERYSEIAIHMLSQTIIQDFVPNTNNSLDFQSISDAGIADQLWIEIDETPRWQNKVAVLKVLKVVLTRLNQEDRSKIITQAWLNLFGDVLTSESEHPSVCIGVYQTWIQYQPGEAGKMIRDRIASPLPDPNDMFIRAGLLRLLSDHDYWHELEGCILDRFASVEPSEHVLIRSSEMVGRFPSNKALEIALRIFDQPVTQLNVKATARVFFSLKDVALKEISVHGETSVFRKIVDFIINCLSANDMHPLCLRSALHAVRAIGFESVRRKTDTEISEFEHGILSAVSRLIVNPGCSETIRREASVVREEILLYRDESARHLMETIQEKSAMLSEGESFELKRKQSDDPDLLGRVLALLAAQDFGFSAIPGPETVRIVKGDVYKRKIWRIINEFTNPDPAKRQGFLHTVGREAIGTIRAPSRILCEITETKVPGERWYDPAESSWRPYIPTLDDILSLCRRDMAGRTISIYSAEGVTEIKGPKKLQDRLMLWVRLTIEYHELAKKRNMGARKLDELMTRSFIQILIEDLNIMIHFKPYAYHYKSRPYSVMDPTVAKNLNPVTGRLFSWR